MARKPRIHLPGGLYHVMLRGNGGQPVFLTDDDRYRFYLLLQEGANRFGFRVHAFCLMKNHIHLALQCGDIPISRAMHNLSFRYTRWINWREKRAGHLFQGRYKAVLVDGDSYLLELVRYIHLNPVRAGMVESPEEYPWSGHSAYLGKEVLLWLTRDWVLGQFGETVVKSRAGYMRFVLEGLNEEHRPEFHGSGNDTRLLGDDNFMDKCLYGTTEKPIRLTLQEIVNKICLAYAIDETRLKAPVQERVASEARAVVGWLANNLGGITLSEVGRFLGRDVGSISSSIRRLSGRIAEKPELANRIMVLKNELAGQSNVSNLEA